VALRSTESAREQGQGVSLLLTLQSDVPPLTLREDDRIDVDHAPGSLILRAASEMAAIRTFFSWS
jgi:hypothetical protein